MKSILSAFEEYLPEMSQNFEKVAIIILQMKRVVSILFIRKSTKFRSITDLRESENVYVIPADLGWSDLGTWNLIYENAEKDTNDNAGKSKHTVTYNAKGNLIKLKNQK